MSFLEPQRLLVLAVVGVLALFYVVLQARRRTYAVRFTNLALLSAVAPKRPGWRRHVPAAFFLLATATLVVGFARPTHEEQVPRERATVILAIDTSLSMEATDVAPTRIEAAKEAASSFLDIVPPKINVGLVAFNGNATLKVPPTTDRAKLKAGIEGLQLGERTAIGEAIFASLDALNQVPSDDQGTKPPARVVLMSDGATTDGRPNEAGAKAAVDAGVPVSTIAFGTDEGTIQVPGESRTVPVRVDQEALKEIADTTQGKFFAAATEGELRDVYADMGSSIGYTTEEREVSSWFIGGALALLLVTSAMSLAWFSRLP
ncbi:MAG: VWA domain-containing protein [Acidimicrobiales bacterium]